MPSDYENGAKKTIDISIKAEKNDRRCVEIGIAGVFVGQG